MRTFAAAVALASAETQLFAPVPAYTPAMNQMQAAAAYGAPAQFAPVDAAEVMYVQSVDEAASDSSAVFYGAGAVLLGAAAFAATKNGQKQSVAEPDLEAATSAVKVAMLFSSGGSRSAPKRGGAKGRKPAPKRGAPKRGKPAPAQDDDDLFFHNTNLLEKSGAVDCFLNRIYE
jgi:hypothetical protein